MLFRVGHAFPLLRLFAALGVSYDRFLMLCHFAVGPEPLPEAYAIQLLRSCYNKAIYHAPSSVATLSKSIWSFDHETQVVAYECSRRFVRYDTDSCAIANRYR